MDFIKQLLKHWELIVGAICSICSVLLFVFKKKPVVGNDDILNFIDSNLLLLVSSAEKLSVSGSEKKDFVVYQIKKLLKQKYAVDTDKFDTYILARIELILMTPNATCYKEEKNDA